MNLQEWIEILEYGHSYRIRIWYDNITPETLKLNFTYRIHNNPLCNYIKTSPEGMKSCIRCRKCAEWTAAKKGGYIGRCVHGLSEYVQPVYLRGKPAATVFIGNLVSDFAAAGELLEKSCKRCSLSYEKAGLLLSEARRDFDIEMLKKIAFAVSELAEEKLNAFSLENKPEFPETVSRLARISGDYETPVTLSAAAEKLGYNQKYLGRLFKKYTGVSFSEYRNRMRLRDAADLIAGSNIKIIDAALSVGFDNVTYFNKVFRIQYGMTPSEYRARMIKKRL